MVDSINASPAPGVPSPPAPDRNDPADSIKTDDLKGDTLSNRATLSAPKPDSPESSEPCEKNAAVGDKPVQQAPASTRNEPPGSTIDLMA